MYDGKVNILLVDDQPAKLLSYQSILAGMGENLVAVHSGRDALKVLMNEDFAVILVDVCMPDMDGFELTKMIREHPRFNKTAIILVSAVHLSDFDRLHGYDSGAVDYVPVPIIPEVLRAKVRIFSELYRKTEELRRFNIDLEQRVTERTSALESSTARLRESEERLHIALDSERAARLEAERAARAKDEFLAMLSHELRSPLNAILGWSQLLKQRTDEDPASLRHGLEIIERNALGQARLIDDLLDVSRILSGKVRLDQRTVDLATAAEAALETVRLSADSRQISLHKQIDPDVPPVRGDIGRLQQVIGNLLSNAVKFTPTGGRVKIELARVESKVELRVSDSGIGIDAAMLPHIFDRFRQADSSITRHYGGLGLGLSIAKHLVELHGGMIHASSAGQDRGAEFVVRLPAYCGENGDRGDPGAPGPVDVSSQSCFAGLRVLVVDDDPDSCTLMVRMLEDRGAIIESANSAAAALEKLASSEFDLLVSDIGMPGKDGYQMISEIRALSSDASNIPAIAATAFSRDEDRLRALSAGFDRYISKPIDSGELLSLVAASLQSRRSQNENRSQTGVPRSWLGCSEASAIPTMVNSPAGRSEKGQRHEALKEDD
ncbi:MAG TPA: response regulator [Phycisphaerae bacterium]|nr:response regulator [Phycisphaerae bacterium]